MPCIGSIACTCAWEGQESGCEELACIECDRVCVRDGYVQAVFRNQLVRYGWTSSAARLPDLDAS